MSTVAMPIFCDECSVFTTAELDNRVLCSECLLAALEEFSREEIEIRVRPLRCHID